jgi:hypothetical protein
MLRRFVVAVGIVVAASAVPFSLQAQFCDTCHTWWDEEFEEYYHFFLGVGGGGWEYECFRGEGCHWQDRTGSCIWVHYPCGWETHQLAALMSVGLLDGDVDAAWDVARYATRIVYGDNGVAVEFQGCGDASLVVVPLLPHGADAQAEARRRGPIGITR